MNIGRIIGALIEGILFAVLMWIGDIYILDNVYPFYVYAIQAIIFAVSMYLLDKFLKWKKKNEWDKAQTLSHLLYRYLPV